MLPGSGPEAAPRFCVKPDFRGRRKSVAPRFLDRLQVSARSPAGGLELRVSVSLKMADEEAGGAERMEVSTELPQTPQLLASSCSWVCGENKLLVYAYLRKVGVRRLQVTSDIIRTLWKKKKKNTLVVGSASRFLYYFLAPFGTVGARNLFC